MAPSREIVEPESHERIVRLSISKSWRAKGDGDNVKTCVEFSCDEMHDARPSLAIIRKQFELISPTQLISP